MMTDWTQDLLPFGLKGLSEHSSKSRANRGLSRLARHLFKKNVLKTYGVAALRESPSTVDEILGGPERWQTSTDAQIAVARTFSGFRIRGMVGNKDGPYTEEDYETTFKHAYPFNWQSIEVFKKVHDWWHWVCHNSLQVALRVHLLSGFLLAGEAFLESDENRNFDLMWKSNDYPLGYEVNVCFNDYDDDYGDRVFFGIDDGRYGKRIDYAITFGEDLKFEFNPGPRTLGWNGERIGPFPTRVDFMHAPTKDNMNDWAVDLITKIETQLGADELYNNILMSKLDNSQNYVESLHIGSKHDMVRGDKYFEDFHQDLGVENQDWSIII